jgi:transposase-like protein
MLAIRDLMREVGGQLQPACPSCGKPLRVTRITPQSCGRADLRTYGCQQCGVWLTEAVADPIGGTIGMAENSSRIGAGRYSSPIVVSPAS